MLFGAIPALGECHALSALEEYIREIINNRLPRLAPPIIFVGMRDTHGGARRRHCTRSVCSSIASR